MLAVLVLVALFQLKHFLADYPLQTPWMLGKFNEKGWFWPLLAHALVHALFTDAIAAVYLVATQPTMPMLQFGGIVAGCGLLDMTVHFTMDRIKASPAMLGRYKALSAREYVHTQKVIANPGSGYAEIMARVAVRDNTRFWLALGLDQLVHHLTDLAVVAVLVLR